MTVEAGASEFVYVGDGVTTTFPFPSRFMEAGDIAVGVGYVEQTSGYTVLGAGAESGGAVVFSVAPPAGVQVALLCRTSPSQLVDFVNGQTVLEGVLNNALDRRALVEQRLLRSVGRSLRLADFDPGVMPELPGAADRAGKLVGFSESGAMALFNGANSVEDMATAIADAQAAAADANSAMSATEAAASEASAALTSVNARWLGAYASRPAASPDGGPLIVGALGFNTTTGRLETYVGAGSWQTQNTSGLTDGPPSPSAGVDGDTMIDAAAVVLYTKAAGTWTGTSLVGPPGTTGASGANGPGVFLNRGEYLEAVADSSGTVAYGVRRDGTFQVNAPLRIGSGGQIASSEKAAQTNGGMLYAERDASGNLAFGVHRDLGPVGPFTPKEVNPLSVSYDATTMLAAVFDDTVLRMTLVIGQSLATQENGGAESTLTTSAVDAGSALMFSVGAWPNGRALGDFTDLKEQPYGSSRETICSGFAKALNARLAAALGGKKHRILMSVIGKTTKQYKDLRKGTAYFDEAMRLVRTARDLAHVHGWRLIVDNILVLHGETDAGSYTNRDQYRKFLAQWQNDLCHGILAANEQIERPRFYAYQCSVSGGSSVPRPVPFAQYDMADRHPDIRCVGPIYDIPRVDGTHQTVIGSFRMGEKFADAVLQDRFGLPSLGPLRVISAAHFSTTQIDVVFNQPVTVDTTDAVVNATDLGAGMGFDFLSAGATTPAISTVAAVAGAGGIIDTIRVTLASAPSGPNKRLFLACRSTGSHAAGPLTGGRSAIRATSPFALSQLDGTTALYHWAPSIMMEIS